MLSFAEIILYIAVGIIGLVYLSDKTSCNYKSIPLFLTIFGFPNALATAIRLYDVQGVAFAQVSYTVGLLFYFAYTMLEDVQTWHADKSYLKDDPGYCDIVPFTVALLVVSVKAVWFIIVFIIYPICLAGALIYGTNLAGFGYSATKPYERGVHAFNI